MILRLQKILSLLFFFLCLTGALHSQDTDCDCEDAEGDPVCVVGPEGFIFQVENACIAECLELEITDEAECEDWDWDGDWNDDWSDCDCEENSNDIGICFSYFDEFFQDSLLGWAPNECFIECWGITDYELTACDDLDGDCGNPWDDCDCDVDPNDEGICYLFVDEFFGDTIQAWAPNECFIECWGITDYELTECDDWNGGWSDCDCDEDPNDEGICFLYFDENNQDSIYGWAPNECFIECWGFVNYTITECDDFDGDWEDTEIDSCLLSIDLASFDLIQTLLLALNESCDLDLPDCILEAPLFDTDEDFISYLEANCDFDGNFGGGVIGGLIDEIIDGEEEPVNENALESVELNLSVRSNPDDGMVHFVIDSNTEGPAILSVYDMTGVQKSKIDLNLIVGTNDGQINAQGFLDNIYILNVSTPTETKNIKFFLK